MARPSDFTEQLALTICDRIADGESLRSICRDDGMPSKASVFKWLGENKWFSDQYTRAKQEQADSLADDILDIADEKTNDFYIDENGNKKVNGEAINRSRLRVDARKWIASKLKPKVYGDRIMNEVSGSLNLQTMTDEELNSRIDELMSGRS